MHTRLPHPRLDPDARYGLRLTLAALATVLVGVPFLLLALLVRGGWEPLREIDTGAAISFNAYALTHPAFVTVLEVLSDAFDPWSWRVFAVVVGAWLLWRGKRRLAVWLLFTVLVGGLLVNGMKEVVGRARPALPEPVSHAPGLSFPSGHAFGVTVGAGVVLLLVLPLVRRAWRPLAWAVAIALVIAVDLARVGLGVHYVSDVTAGTILGLAWLAATTAAFETWRREVGRPPSPVTEGVDPEASRDLAHTPRD